MRKPLTREQVENLIEKVGKGYPWKHELVYLTNTGAALRAKLEAAERDTVPRSRYDECNRDWLDKIDELKKVRQSAQEEIERLQQQLAVFSDPEIHELAQRLLKQVEPILEVPELASLHRSCNMHSDCNEADRIHALEWSGRKAKHCSSEDCEDCFGK